MAQFGRALGSGPRGRRFKSGFPDMKNSLRIISKRVFILPIAHDKTCHMRYNICKII